VDNEVEEEERTEEYLYVAVPGRAIAVITSVDSAESHAESLNVFGIKQLAGDRSHIQARLYFWKDHAFA